MSASEARATPFWRAKRLDEMTDAEWESLCDGCGRCCLVKLQDEDTNDIDYTDVACALLDLDACRCSDYANRSERVPDCVRLTAADPTWVSWMPTSCAYRRVAEGRDLAWWHPLVSGDPQTVIASGASVRGRVVSEKRVPDRRLLDHIRAWPAEEP